MSERLYTEQEMKIALLENNLTKLINNVEKMEERNHTLFVFLMTAVLGLYVLIITTPFLPYLLKLFGKG